MNTEELKRLAEAATPGPWENDVEKDNFGETGGCSYSSIIGIGWHLARIWNDGPNPEADAAYIAAANPAAILELIRQRDELLAALKDAGFILDKLRTASNGEQRRYARSFAGNTIHVAPIVEAIKDAIAKAEG